MTTIVGQGIAGSCLAWNWWFAERRDFVLQDREVRRGSSDVAAGLINPVAGKGWNAGWEIDRALPAAVSFYRQVEEIVGLELLELQPIRRWIDSDKDLRKVEAKLALPEVAKWIDLEASKLPEWVTISGGGRLKTRRFLDATRAFFGEQGMMRISDKIPAKRDLVLCQGAEGILADDSFWRNRHRCAKGEIIAVRAPMGEGPVHIEVRLGKWIIPDGDGVFRVGATYEWDHLDREPTSDAREMLSSWAQRWFRSEIEVVDHVAGIRPIIHQSRPQIERIDNRTIAINGLGSKGALYAPSIEIEV